MFSRNLPCVVSNYALLRSTRCWRGVGLMFSSVARKSTPRRAVMYVPGNDLKKLNKIPTLSVDCAVLDCEDGVATSEKANARKNIASLLPSLQSPTTEAAVRINAISTNQAVADDDLREILSASCPPSTIFLPKVESPYELDWFAKKVSEYKKNDKDKKVKLVLYVESALAMLDLRDICDYGHKRSQESGCSFVLEGVVFGSDDFCADIGAQRSANCDEVSMARQHVVLVAKAHKLQAIDLVYTDYNDAKGLKKQAEEGARMGYTGKQVIHPTQVEIVQQAYSPSDERIRWATTLVAAFAKHQAKGEGAFTFEGNMVDKPLLLQAQNILDLAEIVNSRGTSQEKN